MQLMSVLHFFLLLEESEPVSDEAAITTTLYFPLLGSSKV